MSTRDHRTPAVDAVPTRDVVDAAEAEQRAIAARVVIPTAPVAPPTTVAGLDVSYATDSDRIVAAAVVVDVATGEVIEETTTEGVVGFPYVPGLLAFREVPILLEVLDRLTAPPGLLLCDGQGIAHPRRCGLASHLGVVTGWPAIGAAKNHFVGEHDDPGPTRGDRTMLVDGGEPVGQVLRTRDGVRPIYVSPGHRVGLVEASEIVLAVTRHHRVPDPIRHADHLSRRSLRETRH